MANVPIVAASAAALTASLAGLAGLAQSLAGRSKAEQGRARPVRAVGGGGDEFDDENVNLAESASVWLARRGSSQVLEPQASSYGELELLADGEFVYFRKDTEVLTAIPPYRVLQLQPLQLAKGRPDAVPSAPLEPNSVWLVLRKKQEVVFMLLGSDHERHVLEADPQAPNGVTLGGGNVRKRGRWTITPQGLACVAWPQHLLPLQALTVQLVDARAVGSVKAAMARKLNELANILDGEAHHRAVAETRSQQLELELRRVKDEVASQVAELRAQLDAAVRGRHVAEREVASLQGQKADEAVRAKMAQARAAQAEFEAQQAAANVKGLQQQIQGMLAGHAEELRTLQNELQFAREANDALKRAMGEQVMALQGALELRDARILELEEENERMDTVLQVIQAQLGHGGGVGAVEGFGAAVEQAQVACEAAGAGTRSTAEHEGEGTYASAAGGSTSEPAKSEEAQTGQPPLWKALLDSTGGISLTALKESLEVSRRSNLQEPRHADAHGASEAAPEAEAQPVIVEERTEVDSTEPSAGPSVPEAPADLGHPTDADGSESAGPRAWPFTLSPDRSFSLTEGGGSGPSSCRDTQAASAASNSSSPGKQLQRQHSAAELEFGGAAVVTLDSLRRRMRALAAEYDRCAVLTQSLRESLPWRSTGADAVDGSAGVLAAAAAAASGAGLEPVPEAASEAPDSERCRANINGTGSQRSAALEDVTSPTLAASSGRTSWQASDREEQEDGPGRKRSRKSFGCRLEGVLGSAEAAGSTAAEAANQGGRSNVTAGPHREGVAGPAQGPSASGPRATGSNVQRITQKLLAGAGTAAAEAGTIAASRGPRLDSHAVADSVTSSTATLAGSPHSSSAAVSGATDPCVSASVSEQLSTPFASASVARASGQPVVPLHSSGSDSGAGLEPAAEGDTTVSPPGFTVHYTPWSASVSEEAQVPMPAGSDDSAEEQEGATSTARRISNSLGAAAASRSGTAELPASSSSDSPSGLESDSLSPLPAEDPSGLRAQANGAALIGAAKPAANGRGGTGVGVGRFVPELKLEGTRGHADAGVYESMEMCCLGSTRAFPTARNAAGALTARQVSHSRQASFGAYAAFTAAHDQLTPPLLSPAGATVGPGTAAVDAEASARSPLVEDAQARGASAVAASTPKGVSTPPSGGAALDDDAVHCDDQEPSPPPPGGMLLGTLEQLRGGGGPGTTGKRAALAALEEDDEEEL
ncbi:hypothetical protein CHLRE_01g014300v5 [Chlamydomonas reinhardtii]|uniref:Uncharacterized protein n=1 Tax=Chlamydomonas reinhardtii TaxID=3055 RepID=A0A2K3E5R7_CHLRE|nr:uncharacterized protein CHLRE_01g014300v5 [Chlamydomonas reinhardtii]PNW88103.1 hypothetical protein CHLRE_01g014300v5 [Chlamydomonas reinhardtii]